MLDTINIVFLNVSLAIFISSFKNFLLVFWSHFLNESLLFVVWVLCVFWILIFYQMYSWWLSLQFCGFPFYLTFSIQKFLFLWSITSQLLSLILGQMETYSGRFFFLPTAVSYRILPMVSSNNFIVSSFTFVSLTHLELIFVQSYRYGLNYSLLHMDIWFSEHCLLKMLSFASLCFDIFVKLQCLVMCTHAWNFDLFCSDCWLVCFCPSVKLILWL